MYTPQNRIQCQFTRGLLGQLNSAWECVVVWNTSTSHRLILCVGQRAATALLVARFCSTASVCNIIDLLLNVGRRCLCAIMSAQPSAPVADVVVVGGGLSGLTVALRLTSATPRLSVVLLESRDRLGGRLYADGGVDLGGSWSWPTDTALRGLAKGMHGPRSAFYLIIAYTHCAYIMNSRAVQVGCMLQKSSSWERESELVGKLNTMHVL